MNAIFLLNFGQEARRDDFRRKKLVEIEQTRFLSTVILSSEFKLDKIPV